MSAKIVVVGSINIDLVCSTERLPNPGETVQGISFHEYPGGKGANQAVAAARLGADVTLVGFVGDDSHGHYLRGLLSSEGIHTEFVQSSAARTGLACISTNLEGLNTIVLIPGANQDLRPECLSAAERAIITADIVLVQLEVPIETVLALSKLCRLHGKPLILDPAPVVPIPEEVFPAVHWLTPNETETESLKRAYGMHQNFLTDSDALLSLGVKGVILKQGEQGVKIVSSSSAPADIPAFAVHAVDTTAAGDCFNAAFAVAIGEGSTPENAALFACGAAALSVTRLGAQPSLPTRREVETFIRSRIEMPMIGF